jgi:hypothetical protein
MICVYFFIFPLLTFLKQVHLLLCIATVETAKGERVNKRKRYDEAKIKLLSHVNINTIN